MLRYAYVVCLANLCSASGRERDCLDPGSFILCTLCGCERREEGMVDLLLHRFQLLNPQARSGCCSECLSYPGCPFTAVYFINVRCILIT